MAGTLRSAVHPQRSRLILSAGLALSNCLTHFPSALASLVRGPRQLTRRNIYLTQCVDTGLCAALRDLQEAEPATAAAQNDCFVY